MYRADSLDANSDMPHDGRGSPPGRIALVILWAIFVAAVGGYAGGMAFDRFAEVGGLSLWALGAVAGYVGRWIMAGPSRPAGGILVASCFTALVIADVCWLHWNTVQGEPSWWQAFLFLPTFFWEFKVPAFVGVVFTALGASAAYRAICR